MPDTAMTPLRTPAEVASAILDAIESHPTAFFMGDWVRLAADAPLPPYVAPPCGTTLCAAGWAAHLTGWTLVVLDDDQDLAEVTVTHADGSETGGFASRYAEKNGEKREICQVAAAALGFGPTGGFWYADEDSALVRLREIAGR